MVVLQEGKINSTCEKIQTANIILKKSVTSKTVRMLMVGDKTIEFYSAGQWLKAVCETPLLSAQFFESG